MELFFHNEIEIDPLNPFKYDALGRKEQVEILTSLIENANIKDMVLSIDAKWGEGKTTFIKMWEQHLEINGYRTLYYNAWESDYVENPFINFSNSFEEFLKADSDIDKLKKIGIKAVKAVAPGLIKFATAGILDTEKLIADKGTSDFIVSCAEKIANSQIQDMKASLNVVKEFKDTLAEFVEKINDATGKPVIFFIDELDRCKPTFAIQLLEQIKHIFNISGVIYVLSIDKTQLGNSLQAVYGTGIDVDGYLARFLDVEYTLEEPQENKYINYLFEKYKMENYYVNQQKSGFEQKYIFPLIHNFHFSLRQIEKIINRLIIIRATDDKSDYKDDIYNHLLLFLLCLEFSNKDLYRKVINMETNIKEISEAVGGWFDYYTLSDLTVGVYIRGCLAGLLGDSVEYDRIKDFLDDHDEGNANDVMCYEAVLHVIEDISEKYAPGGVRYLILNRISNKINICKKFTVN